MEIGKITRYATNKISGEIVRDIGLSHGPNDIRKNPSIRIINPVISSSELVLVQKSENSTFSFPLFCLLEEVCFFFLSTFTIFVIVLYLKY
jgi:hypothetical protein